VTTVAVCIPTHRRPQWLARLLEGLGAQRFAGQAPRVQVVVVDNDAAGTARGVCEAAARALPWPLRYVVEPERGISAARNRAVREAGGAEWLAWIDDDECPEPEWLDALLRTAAAHDADAVAGPVLPRFETPPPAWVLRGGFFDRGRPATGTRLPYAGLGNALVRAPVFRALGEPCFEAALSLIGGEDTLFFLRATGAGFRLVWADDAVVHETVPAERVRLAWILRRAYRTGSAWTLCERRMRPGARRTALRAAKGFAWMASGAGALPLAAVRGPAAAVDGLRRICRGAGNLAGLAGVSVLEYQRTDGR
jgi:succinoglycan biosynthesis protein ExoM